MKNNHIATYRLQLNKDFTFQNAASVADYLRDLNISHLYLSPILESVSGSNHGYDVSDFSAISAERGGLGGFKELAKKICAYDYPMNVVLDIVPNHMAANMQNPYWNDILEKGSQSEFWPLFDVRVKDNQKIRLPLLGDDFENALQKNEIEIVKQNDKYFFQYYETIIPLSPESKDVLNQKPDTDLKTIHELQHYKLVVWTDTEQYMCYRRFFDVTGLVGVRVEEEEVYKKTHGYIFELLKLYPCISGLRIDHIDGLAEPKAYLERLSEVMSTVWIEKILSRDEDIAEDWKTSGTTGYEFIDRLNQLLVHPENFRKIQENWLDKTQSKWKNFESCVLDSKKQVLNQLFEPELERVVKLSSGSPENHDKAHVFWESLTTSLPVYRVYKEQDFSNSPWINAAAQNAKERFGEEFIEAESLFMPVLCDPKTGHDMRAVKEWQQLSGPAMAKGLEDTAHYRFTPLTALNEVGCAATLTATDKEDYFSWLQKRNERFPLAMNATSSHDTKRSEDTRHRLYALADRPNLWIDFVKSASALNNPGSISPATEDFIYQALIGTWPLDDAIDDDYKKRIKAYLQKADREARIQTSWKAPSEVFEQTIENFIDKILESKDFQSLTNDLMQHIAPCGAINSLTVQTLKILAPGIPDLYQGSEIWEFNLVDPDNRQPVNYSLRQELLFVADNVEGQSGRERLLEYLCKNWQDGTIKLWLTRQLLRIRQDHLSTLANLNIIPLKTSGKYHDHLVAYSLSSHDSTGGLIVLCPRYPGLLPFKKPLALDWENTAVEFEGSNFAFKDLIHNRLIQWEDLKNISNLLSEFPISVISFE